MCFIGNALPLSSPGSATCRQSKSSKTVWAAAASFIPYQQRSMETLLLRLDEKGVPVLLIMLHYASLSNPRATRCEGARKAGVKCLRSALKTGKLRAELG